MRARTGEGESTSVSSSPVSGTGESRLLLILPVGGRSHEETDEGGEGDTLAGEAVGVCGTPGSSTSSSVSLEKLSSKIPGGGSNVSS